MVGKLLPDIESSKVKQCIPDLAKWKDLRTKLTCNNIISLFKIGLEYYKAIAHPVVKRF